MLQLHPSFDQELPRLRREIAPIEGYLARRDVHILALAAAHPTASGEVLEIGAFRGKSTVLLSKAAALAGNPRVISCDPLTWAQGNNPPAPEVASARFTQNLRAAGVLRNIEFHQTTSGELGERWNRPLRMLWLDGDHTYPGVMRDLQLFAPHLVDGGVLLMHDILSAWPGPNRAFIEFVLQSPNFGSCGLHGNIGWAQFRSDAAATARHAASKQSLARRLRPLIPYQTSEHGQLVHFGWSKWAFKMLRWRAQWGSVPMSAWLSQLSEPSPQRKAA